MLGGLWLYASLCESDDDESEEEYEKFWPFTPNHTYKPIGLIRNCPKLHTNLQKVRVRATWFFVQIQIHDRFPNTFYSR